MDWNTIFSVLATGNAAYWLIVIRIGKNICLLIEIDTSVVMHTLNIREIYK